MSYPSFHGQAEAESGFEPRLSVPGTTNLLCPFLCCVAILCVRKLVLIPELYLNNLFSPQVGIFIPREDLQIQSTTQSRKYGGGQ